jgi:hypothetical protein
MDNEKSDEEMMQAIKEKADNIFQYFIKEGFVEKDEAGKYIYTPAGYVVAREQYKRLHERGEI